MAPRKKTPKSANGGRVTTRDLLNAVTGLSGRIDGLHERDDAAVERHQRLSEQMTELHGSMHDLREVTNERLHDMKADITALKRPWRLLANGWTKAVTLGGVAAAISGTVVRLELWRFIPGL